MNSGAQQGFVLLLEDEGKVQQKLNQIQQIQRDVAGQAAQLSQNQSTGADVIAQGLLAIDNKIKEWEACVQDVASYEPVEWRMQPGATFPSIQSLKSPELAASFVYDAQQWINLADICILIKNIIDNSPFLRVVQSAEEGQTKGRQHSSYHVTEIRNMIEDRINLGAFIRDLGINRIIQAETLEDLEDAVYEILGKLAKRHNSSFLSERLYGMICLISLEIPNSLQKIFQRDSLMHSSDLNGLINTLKSTQDMILHWRTQMSNIFNIQMKYFAQIEASQKQAQSSREFAAGGSASQYAQSALLQISQQSQQKKTVDWVQKLLVDPLQTKGSKNDSIEQRIHLVEAVAQEFFVLINACTEIFKARKVDMQKVMGEEQTSIRKQQSRHQIQINIEGDFNQTRARIKQMQIGSDQRNNNQGLHKKNSVINLQIEEENKEVSKFNHPIDILVNGYAAFIDEIESIIFDFTQFGEEKWQILKSTLFAPAPSSNDFSNDGLDQINTGNIFDNSQMRNITSQYSQSSFIPYSYTHTALFNRFDQSICDLINRHIIVKGSGPEAVYQTLCRFGPLLGRSRIKQENTLRLDLFRKGLEDVQNYLSSLRDHTIYIPSA
ncbi:MAG: hypothetical protein EZS28_013958, partial [Streblomastix strix]